MTSLQTIADLTELGPLLHPELHLTAVMQVEWKTVFTRRPYLSAPLLPPLIPPLIPPLLRLRDIPWKAEWKRQRL